MIPERIPLTADDVKVIRNCARVLSSQGNKMLLISQILRDTISNDDITELLGILSVAIIKARNLESRLCEMQIFFNIPNF